MHREPYTQEAEVSCTFHDHDGRRLYLNCPVTVHVVPGRHSKHPEADENPDEVTITHGPVLVEELNSLGDPTGSYNEMPYEHLTVTQQVALDRAIKDSINHGKLSVVPEDTVDVDETDWSED